MANYNDYDLEEMENSAVNKSKNLKRGLAVGAGVLGVGGAAVAANAVIDHNAHTDDLAELTPDDIVAGAEVEATPEVEVQQVHHHHDHIVAKPVIPEDSYDPDIEINETALILDEDGDVVGVYDEGTIDGTKFVVYDTDGNGKGDIIGIDANHNGEIEDNELTYLDNKTYQVGQGKEFVVLQHDETGNLHEIHRQPMHEFAYDDDHHNHHDGIDDIHNDFEDEKTGEEYNHDFAHNNHDYNNNEAEQYSAGMDHHDANNYDGHEAAYEEFNEHETYNGIELDGESELATGHIDDYGYDEGSSDFASTDNFDEALNYDA